MRNDKPTKEEKAEALVKLRKLVPKGARVYGIVRKISASGMSREIDFYYLDGPKVLGSTGRKRIVHPVWLTPWFRYVTGYRPAKDDRGLVVGGCGMDMILHVVSSVAWEVHGEDRAWQYASL